MFGNTYYVCYAITENKISINKQKTKTNDIIINVREIHDSRFLP